MKSSLRILSFLKPYWIYALAAPLLMVVEVVMDLSQPRLMMAIVDTGLPAMDYSMIIRTGLFMLVAALIGLAGGAGCGVFSTLAGIGMGADLRSALYRKILSLAPAEADRLTPGSLVTRLTNDITQIQESVMMMLRILVRAPLLMVGSLILTVMISPRLSLILAGLIPVLILGVFLVIKFAFPLFSRVQERVDGINRIIRENLMGIRVIKAFVREEHEAARFGEGNRALAAISNKAGNTIAMIHPVMTLVLNAGIILVLYFGGRLTASGAITTGKLLAFINYLMQLLMALMMVGMILIRFSRTEASAKRIMEVLDSRPETDRPGVPVAVKRAGTLRFEQVSFTYDGREEERPVLNGINFDLEPGRVLAVIGSTGSGKTTLAHLIPRLLEATTGRITLDGRDIRDIPLAQLRSLIGLVPQQTTLFSGTIRENIGYGDPDADDGALLRAAETARIADFVKGLEQGLDTPLNQKGLNLSGGQKQRISIARALLPAPPILILDDSTSALDAETERTLLTALEKDHDSRSLLMITQRVSTARRADTILVLDDGNQTGLGTHAELLESCPVYAEIVRSQDGIHE